MLSSAVQAGLAMSRFPLDECAQSEGMAANFNASSSSFLEGSTEYRTGFFEAGSFGTLKKNKKLRK